jgi:nucleoside-diphosphate-sugar epimerase
MQVLVIGASGFIGSRIVSELMRRNHSLLCAGRRPVALMQRFPRSRAMRADLASDTADDWLPRLRCMPIWSDCSTMGRASSSEPALVQGSCT